MKSTKIWLIIDKANCADSDIGDVFEYSSSKWLIVVCGDLNVVLYSFDDDSVTKLLQVTSNPYALRAFSDAGIVAIGDYVSGEAYIYQFNPETYAFKYFM